MLQQRAFNSTRSALTGAVVNAILAKEVVAGREYFGRVWTLAERLARYGRKEQLSQWLSLEVRRCVVVSWWCHGGVMVVSWWCNGGWKDVKLSRAGRLELHTCGCPASAFQYGANSPLYASCCTLGQQAVRSPALVIAHTYLGSTPSVKPRCITVCMAEASSRDRQHAAVPLSRLSPQIVVCSPLCPPLCSYRYLFCRRGWAWWWTPCSTPWRTRAARR